MGSAHKIKCSCTTLAHEVVDLMIVDTLKGLLGSNISSSSNIVPYGMNMPMTKWRQFLCSHALFCIMMLHQLFFLTPRVVHHRVGSLLVRILALKVRIDKKLWKN